MELVTKTEPASYLYPGYPIDFTLCRHTLQDLLDIKLDYPKRLVRLYVDSPILKEVDWDKKLEDVFAKYKRFAASNHPWWKPRLSGWWDTFRWDLHLKLLKWKVIV